MKKCKPFFLFAGVFVTGVFVGVFVTACAWIGTDVKRQCREAVQLYGGDCVSALSIRVEDDTQSYRARNSAVWALGQMGDRQALPVLQKYYTGTFPVKESLDSVISQYELKKAIKLAGGGVNITALFWR